MYNQSNYFSFQHPNMKFPMDFENSEQHYPMNSQNNSQWQRGRGRARNFTNRTYFRPVRPSTYPQENSILRNDYVYEPCFWGWEDQRRHYFDVPISHYDRKPYLRRQEYYDTGAGSSKRYSRGFRGSKKFSPKNTGGISTRKNLLDPNKPGISDVESTKDLKLNVNSGTPGVEANKESTSLLSTLVASTDDIELSDVSTDSFCLENSLKEKTETESATLVELSTENTQQGVKSRNELDSGQDSTVREYKKEATVTLIFSENNTVSDPRVESRNLTFAQEFALLNWEDEEVEVNVSEKKTDVCKEKMKSRKRENIPVDKYQKEYATKVSDRVGRSRTVSIRNYADVCRSNVYHLKKYNRSLKGLNLCCHVEIRRNECEMTNEYRKCSTILSSERTIYLEPTKKSEIHSSNEKILESNSLSVEYCGSQTNEKLCGGGEMANSHSNEARDEIAFLEGRARLIKNTVEQSKVELSRALLHQEILKQNKTNQLNFYNELIFDEEINEANSTKKQKQEEIKEIKLGQKNGNKSGITSIIMEETNKEVKCPRLNSNNPTIPEASEKPAWRNSECEVENCRRKIVVSKRPEETRGNLDHRTINIFSTDAKKPSITRLSERTSGRKQENSNENKSKKALNNRGVEVMEKLEPVNTKEPNLLESSKNQETMRVKIPKSVVNFEKLKEVKHPNKSRLQEIFGDDLSSLAKDEECSHLARTQSKTASRNEETGTTDMSNVKPKRIDRRRSTVACSDRIKHDDSKQSNLVNEKASFHSVRKQSEAVTTKEEKRITRMMSKYLDEPKKIGRRRSTVVCSEPSNSSDMLNEKDYSHTQSKAVPKKEESMTQHDIKPNKIKRRRCTVASTEPMKLTDSNLSNLVNEKNSIHLSKKQSKVVPKEEKRTTRQDVKPKKIGSRRCTVDYTEPINCQDSNSSNLVNGRDSIHLANKQSKVVPKEENRVAQQDVKPKKIVGRRCTVAYNEPINREYSNLLKLVEEKNSPYSAETDPKFVLKKEEKRMTRQDVRANQKESEISARSGPNREIQNPSKFLNDKDSPLLPGTRSKTVLENNERAMKRRMSVHREDADVGPKKIERRRSTLACSEPLAHEGSNRSNFVSENEPSNLARTQTKTVPKKDEKGMKREMSVHAKEADSKSKKIEQGSSVSINFHRIEDLIGGKFESSGGTEESETIQKIAEEIRMNRSPNVLSLPEIDIEPLNSSEDILDILNESNITVYDPVEVRCEIMVSCAKPEEKRTAVFTDGRNSRRSCGTRSVNAALDGQFVSAIAKERRESLVGSPTITVKCPGFPSELPENRLEAVETFKPIIVPFCRVKSGVVQDMSEVATSLKATRAEVIEPFIDLAQEEYNLKTFNEIQITTVQANTPTLVKQEVEEEIVIQIRTCPNPEVKVETISLCDELDEVKQESPLDDPVKFAFVVKLEDKPREAVEVFGSIPINECKVETSIVKDCMVQAVETKVKLKFGSSKLLGLNENDSTVNAVHARTDSINANEAKTSSNVEAGTLPKSIQTQNVQQMMYGRYGYTQGEACGNPSLIYTNIYQVGGMNMSRSSAGSAPSVLPQNQSIPLTRQSVLPQNSDPRNATRIGAYHGIPLTRQSVLHQNSDSRYATPTPVNQSIPLTRKSVLPQNSDPRNATRTAANQGIHLTRQSVLPQNSDPRYATHTAANQGIPLTRQSVLPQNPSSLPSEQIKSMGRQNEVFCCTMEALLASYFVQNKSYYEAYKKICGDLASTRTPYSNPIDFDVEKNSIHSLMLHRQKILASHILDAASKLTSNDLVCFNWKSFLGYLTSRIPYRNTQIMEGLVTLIYLYEEDYNKTLLLMRFKNGAYGVYRQLWTMSATLKARQDLKDQKVIGLTAEQRNILEAQIRVYLQISRTHSEITSRKQIQNNVVKDSTSYSSESLLRMKNLNNKEQLSKQNVSTKNPIPGPLPNRQRVQPLMKSVQQIRTEVVGSKFQTPQQNNLQPPTETRIFGSNNSNAVNSTFLPVPFPSNVQQHLGPPPQYPSHNMTRPTEHLPSQVNRGSQVLVDLLNRRPVYPPVGVQDQLAAPQPSQLKETTYNQNTAGQITEYNIRNADSLGQVVSVHPPGKVLQTKTWIPPQVQTTISPIIMPTIVREYDHLVPSSPSSISSLTPSEIATNPADKDETRGTYANQDTTRSQDVFTDTSQVREENNIERNPTTLPDREDRILDLTSPTIKGEVFNISDDVIDLTWIDEEYVKEEVEQWDPNFSIQIKEESDKTSTCLENQPGSEEREGTDASVPVNLEENPALVQGNALCICGKYADYVCICDVVAYCSQECQYIDWINHRKTCQGAKNICSFGSELQY